LITFEQGDGESDYFKLEEGESYLMFLKRDDPAVNIFSDFWVGRGTMPLTTYKNEQYVEVAIMTIKIDIKIKPVKNKQIYQRMPMKIGITEVYKLKEVTENIKKIMGKDRGV